MSTPQGTTVVAPARCAEPGELEHLVGAGGDDAVDPAGDGPLGGDPAGRAGVVGALVAALDAAQGVEGLHDGQVQRGGGGHRGHARHPEVRVHDVRPLRRPVGAERAGERGQVGHELVLGHRRRAGPRRRCAPSCRAAR